jgi:hypothetical protein
VRGTASFSHLRLLALVSLLALVLLKRETAAETAAGLKREPRREGGGAETERQRDRDGQGDREREGERKRERRREGES